jgi:hypothetical protein
LVGLGLALASLTVLPWVHAFEQSISLPDIRHAFEQADSPTSGIGTPSTPATTLPITTLPPITTAPPGQGGTPPLNTVVPPIGDLSDQPSASLPASDSSSSRDDFIETYARWLWIVSLGLAALALLLSTALVPSDISGRMATGFLMGGIVGLMINGLDKKGTWGPRLAAALACLIAGGLHVAAMVNLFTGDGAPDPAAGPWIGLLGFAIVLTGCVIGTRTEEVQRPWAPMVPAASMVPMGPIPPMGRVIPGGPRPPVPGPPMPGLPPPMPQPPMPRPPPPGPPDPFR